MLASVWTCFRPPLSVPLHSPWNANMRLPQDAEDALACCLDAVADPLGWGTALQRLGESLGAESCTCGSGDLKQLSALVMPVSTGHEAFRDLWLRNERHAPDPHFDHARWRRNKGSTVVLEHHLCTDDERRTLPYYQETARLAEREWLANSTFVVGNSTWWMAVYRSDRRGPFTADEAPLLAMVGPRLAPIVSMAEKCSAFQVTSSLRGLDQARCAAFVVDARGHVVNLNCQAENLLGADIRLSGRLLVAGDASSNVALQQFVARGIAARKGETFAPDPVAIRCGGEVHYLVEAIPITTVLSAFFSAARILLLVTNLRAQAAPAETVFCQGLGLTTAEARLARVLASGHDLEEAVRLLGIRMPTARSQLQAIFGKTDTRRQAELMRLLTRLAGRSGRDVEQLKFSSATSPRKQGRIK
jgi:DNA-binding CsgD family transcriptional regulator